MTEFVSVGIKITIGILTVLSGMVAYIWNTYTQDLPVPESYKWVLGPSGAVVLLLIATSTLYKYLREKEKRIEELNKQMLEEAQKEARFWKDQALKNDTTTSK